MKNKPGPKKKKASERGKAITFYANRNSRIACNSIPKEYGLSHFINEAIYYFVEMNGGK